MAPHFVDGKYFQVRKQDRGSLQSSVFHPHTGGHESPCSRLSRGLDVCVPGPAPGACSAPAARHCHSELPGGGRGAEQLPPAPRPLPSGSSPLLPCPTPLCWPFLGESSHSMAPAPAVPPAPCPGWALSVIWESPADPRHLLCCPHRAVSDAGCGWTVPSGHCTL